MTLASGSIDFLGGLAGRAEKVGLVLAVGSSKLSSSKTAVSIFSRGFLVAVILASGETSAVGSLAA